MYNAQNQNYIKQNLKVENISKNKTLASNLMGKKKYMKNPATFTKRIWDCVTF